MNFMWNAEGIRISDSISARCDNTTVWIVGHGIIQRGDNHEAFRWDAMATPLGWYVTIYTFGGVLKGSAQGATFNLPLEVASIVRRIL